MFQSGISDLKRLLLRARSCSVIAITVWLMGLTVAYAQCVSLSCAQQSSNLQFTTPESQVLNFTIKCFSEDGTGTVTSCTIGNPPTVTAGAIVYDGTDNDFDFFFTYTPPTGTVTQAQATLDFSGPPNADGSVPDLQNVATITIVPPPVAGNTSLSLPFGAGGQVDLPASGQVSGLQLASNPGHGSASISGDVASYQPSAGFFGADAFNFIATGPGGPSNVATVFVNVAAPPPPTVGAATISTPFQTPGSASVASAGVTSGFALVSQPAHGSASISGNVITYTPAAGFSGADAFTYVAFGPGGNSNTGTVSVRVGPPPPTAANGVFSTPFNTALKASLPLTGDVTGWSVRADPAHGALTPGPNFTFTYTPNTGYFGSDSFTYSGAGPGGASGVATITINIQLPPPPAANAATLTVPFQTAGSVNLSAGGVVSSFAIASSPTHGAVGLSNSTATYTPANGYWGPDSFTFTATGPGGASAPATVSITVQVPPAPVAQSQSITCPYQTTCTTTVSATGVLTGITLGDPAAANGACSLSGNVLTYVPAFGAVGPDACTIVAAGPGGSTTATIFITNLPPPLPVPGGDTGSTETSVGGQAAAICANGQSVSFPVLPGPPTGTAYDPNWCDEQVLTIAQQALQITNMTAQLGVMQNQVVAAQRAVQSLGSDATSATLAPINLQAAKILQQASGIGFNSVSAGAAFAAAYPTGATVAGFNSTQLNAALSTWQNNTAQALQTSVQVQNQVAQSQASIASAVANGVAVSNAAAGATAARQATGQLLAAVSTQIGQLQDILVAQGQAQVAVDAAHQQAASAAAATAAQTAAQKANNLTAAPGVSNTSSL